MPKGLTTQPLVLAVFPGWLNQPAILELAVKGHRVLNLATTDLRTAPPIDVFISPAAGWDEANFAPETRKSGETYYPFCDEAVLLARRQKNERKKKDAGV